MAEVIETPRDCFEESCQLPSKGLTGNGLALLTPGNIAGNFYIFHPQAAAYENHKRVNFKSRPSSPSDEETGIALAIAPYFGLEDLPPEMRSFHHANHPRDNPVFKTTVGGSVLRFGRVQEVAIWQHNGDHPTAFHNNYGDRSGLPDTLEEQVGHVGLLAANFIPKQVVDTSNGEPGVKDASVEERRFLEQTVQPSVLSDESLERFHAVVMPDASIEDARRELTGLHESNARRHYEFFRYGRSEVGEFIKLFVIRQDLSVFNQAMMKRFIMHGEPPNGRALLEQATEEASNRATVKGIPFGMVYLSLRARGLISANMPPTGREFLLTALGTEVRLRMSVMPTFRSVLKDAYEQVA